MLINFFYISDLLTLGFFNESQQWDLPSKYLLDLHYHHSSNYILNSDLLVLIVLFGKISYSVLL